MEVVKPLEKVNCEQTGTEWCTWDERKKLFDSVALLFQLKSDSEGKTYCTHSRLMAPSPTGVLYVIETLHSFVGDFFAPWVTEL